MAGLGFPPDDPRRALPQQLFLMQAVREALSSLSGEDPEGTGLFVGMEVDAGINRYNLRWHHSDSFGETLDGVAPELDSAGVSGCMPNIPANRLNSLFDVGGMGLTLARGTEGGVVALQLALETLRRGDLDVAVAGAVEMAVDPVHERAMAGHFPIFPSKVAMPPWR